MNSALSSETAVCRTNRPHSVINKGCFSVSLVSELRSIVAVICLEQELSKILHQQGKEDKKCDPESNYKYSDAAKTISLLIVETASSNLDSSSVSPIDLAARMSC